MSLNISGTGAQIRLLASNTYPTGITLTQFADDTDPIDIPSMQVADSSKGLNADLLIWDVNNPIKVTLALQPDSPDDKNMSNLLQANRSSFGRPSARDIITLLVIFPDGSVLTLIDGGLTDGMPGTSIASSGRKKSKTYGFSFREASTI